MKINRIHIRGFGKLKDYTLDFSNGFNLVYGDNEAGKSTVMAFIKMMFYGSGKSSSSILKSPRKKYLPLKSDDFGGSIEFTVGKTNYRLDRTFKKSDSADRITLFNLNTGVEENVASGGDIGATFFGLTAAAFEKSVFVGSYSNCTGDTEAAGEIGSKLANLVSSGDEEVSFEKVAANLANAKHYYLSKSGNIGVLDKLKKRAALLNDELNSAKNSDAQKREKHLRAESLKGLISQTEKQSEELSADIKLSETYDKAKVLMRTLEGFDDLEKVSAGLKAAEDSLKRGEIIADDAFFAGLEERFTTLKILHTQTQQNQNGATVSPKEEIENRSANIRSIKNQREEIVSLIHSNEQKIASLSDEVSLMKPKPMWWLCILGIVAAVTGGVCCFSVDLLIGGIVAVLGVILTVLGLVIKKVPKKLVAASLELDTAKAEQSALQLRLTAADDQIAAEEKMLQAAQSSLTAFEAAEAVKAQYDDCVNEIKTALAPFGNSETLEDCVELIKKLKENAKVAKELSVKLTAIKSLVEKNGDRQSVEAELKELGELPSPTDERLLSITDKRRRLQANAVRISDLKSELSATLTEINTAYRAVKTVPQVELELESVNRDIQRQEAYCLALDEAYDSLKEAFSELMGSFGPTLNRRTAEIFSSLTNGSYTGAVVSKDLSLSAEGGNVGGLISWEYLSSGTVDQAYLSLRLAVAELISQNGEDLPILLDDPFLFYDDSRAASAISFINGYSAKKQTILFTCKGDVKTAAEKLDANVVEL